ncbi:D-alanyl-D-alanine carboxypeptidase family protein [Sphaerisporangium corydalis]|uniref:D-alanyl-D-alanine carboxypeptidase family protein n=1 Tax=Sphaerisporangium corydalis TaxID=1441875 RepID=A0ABV9E9F6_9ACTN|nr:serine hydrolase [Sphaerisporangium corydalis]
MRMVTVLLLAALLTAAGLTGPALARTAPLVTAKEVYLVDVTSGTVQFAKRETRRAPVASLTKIMTAYVVRHSASLDDVVTVSRADVRHAASSGATRAGLRAGERLTVRDLLYALLLPSGADASNALARRYGPGVQRFVAKMNRAAAALGLRDTVYTNPDGLPQTGGDHSTARDQVALARIVLKDPVIAAVVRTPRHAVTRTGAHRAHAWHNTNRLLPGEAEGLKTGYTRAAGYCLMFVSVVGGHTMVGVLLGDTSDAARYRTARRLLTTATARAAPRDV